MSELAPGHADLKAVIAERLSGKTGRAFWRSLDELSGAPAFQAFVEAEFPALAPSAGDVSRRSLLKIMAASLALAGLTGCNAEFDEKALPYVTQPDDILPGIAQWYATAVIFAGYAQPVLGKTHVGRPVKLEGNPRHPASLGASDAFTQAALLGLYDPDRSAAPLFMGRAATWDAFDTAMTTRAAELDARRGEGFRLLTGTVTSPTLARQIDEMLRRWPAARWHVHEPINDDRRLEATRLVFGEPLDQHMRLDQAEIVVSLDDDFLGSGPRQTLHGRLWSQRRRAFQEGEGGSRFLVAEPTPTLTGIVAGERLIVSHQQIGALMSALAAAFGIGTVAGELSADEQAWIERAAASLERHRGRGIVTVGSQHSPEIQALALLVNEALGNLGGPLALTLPIAVQPPDGDRSLKVLAEDMAAGRVTTLAVLNADPAATAPVDLDFAAVMGRVDLRLHAGLYSNATAELSHWHAPLQHVLESWSDARAVDGRASIVQPLVKPFYAVRSPHVVLANWMGKNGSDRDLVENTWRGVWGDTFDQRWQDALIQGFVEASAPEPQAPIVRNRDVVRPQREAPSGLDLVLRPDPTIWDGRFSANSWLQELPKPISKIVWGNALFVSPQLAAARNLVNGDEIRVTVGARHLTGPIWIMPGQEAQTIVATLGYGRSGTGETEGRGYDAYRLRSSEEPWHAGGVTLAVTGERQVIATTQPHHAMDGFDFVRTVAADMAQAPKLAKEPSPSFYPEKTWPSPSWGMSIDLDTCIGCNACVVACQAENNIPVVGKDLVAQGRGMHWLRIDHYFEGEPDAPAMHFQPVPCMHCEDAPCEMGCPVNAAVHSFDGLNLQVYNRCIGTRTCSSFCPYKVRRFNWFDFTKDDPEPVKAMRNPDVTVRQRGVMEKCTYCVQRISAARIEAKKGGREIGEGEVVTACQQACPTSAIVFGDVTNPASAVSRLKAGGRDYTLLEEVNTRPRTTYLAKIEDAPDTAGKGR